MSVWYAIPSKRPLADAERCLDAWAAKGYRIAVFRDSGEPFPRCATFGDTMRPYPGYARAVNELALGILELDPDAEWIVTGGDDVWPDERWRAIDIGEECTRNFRGTFGVMQPTGDRWGADQAQPNFAGSAYIDRVCGSPWMGREFCERINGGQGPLWPEYTHMFVDEELQNVAQSLGILWQRPDLTQRHEHWARGAQRTVPEFLREVNTREHWNQYKALFEDRKANGFPGHQALVCA